MNNRNKIKEIWKAAKSLEGTVIYNDNMAENLQFVRNSKELAKTHEWLYHCTTVSALRSILKNREFWLSNLHMECAEGLEKNYMIRIGQQKRK